MSFAKRTRRLLGYVLGFYEAARWHPRRGFQVIGKSQDAWLDMESSTHEVIRSWSRHLECNDWLANKLGSVFCQYVVGSDGLAVTPASSDQTYNDWAAEQWGIASELIDIETMQGFGDFQWRSTWRRFFDGDAFWLKVRGSNGFGRLQLIESHRIRQPENVQPTPLFNNGVETDTTGRPVRYWIDAKGDGKPQAYDAGLVIPIIDRTRARQTRGLPHLTPVINQIRDLRTLAGLELDKAHEHAARALAIETESGEGDVEDLLRAAETVTSGSTDIGQDTETRTKFIKEVTGSAVMFMKKGEKVNSIGSESPSAATQWLWDYSIGMICAGSQISKLLIMPWSLQGTVTRADLDAQAAIFRAQSAIEANAVRQGYAWVIENSKGGPLRPKDWRRCAVRPPRGVNVDVGRNSSALLAELKAGTRTFRDVYAELGMDWREALKQKALEAEYIMKLAQDAKVNPSQISDITSAPEPQQPQPQTT